MKYQVWAWNGHYIRGTKVGRRQTSRAKAIEKAKTISGFDHINEDEDGILIEDQEFMPIGLIEVFPK